MPLFVRSGLIQMQTMWRLLRINGGAMLLAALIPFICSHLVVMQARHIGMPIRLGLDLVHGLFVLSYLTAVVGMAFQGWAKFGLAVPKPRWPGIRPLVLATFAVGLIGLPVAFALHPVTQGLEAIAAGRGGWWAFIPTAMLPEFIMTTLVGLALAAGTRTRET
ncbi:MAG: hypothetical protein JKY17_07330 [Magnetovibrio sp.]|nr:hypothetical protein [Magnetovibrio sp.]